MKALAGEKIKIEPEVSIAYIEKNIFYTKVQVHLTCACVFLVGAFVRAWEQRAVRWCAQRFRF
jgi:hypothetical protein